MGLWRLDTTFNIIDILILAVELIGAVLVIITLREDKKVKQAEFIMNYNFHFISSKPLVEMERKLENCYQIYNDYTKRQEKYSEIQNEMVKEIDLKRVTENKERVTSEYQELINYLVYLESLAPLILTKQIDLKDIDDTFGYRYFIAMNNPVVQEYELLQEADYYCGCIKVYETWYKFRKKNGKSIPMEAFALSNTDGENMNPVYKACQREESLVEKYKRITAKKINGVKRSDR